MLCRWRYSCVLLNDKGFYGVETSCLSHVYFCVCLQYSCRPLHCSLVRAFFFYSYFRDIRTLVLSFSTWCSLHSLFMVDIKHRNTKKYDLCHLPFSQFLISGEKIIYSFMNSNCIMKLLILSTLYIIILWDQWNRMVRHWTVVLDSKWMKVSGYIFKTTFKSNLTYIIWNKNWIQILNINHVEKQKNCLDDYCHCSVTAW